MQKIFSQFLGSTLLIFVVFYGSAFAESARSLVESGNEAFNQGDYTASLKHYEKAVEAEPDSAIILFNKGDALYKQGKFDEALNVFEQAAEKARENNEQMLEAQSHYNMGNCSFGKAQNSSGENLKETLEEYQRSSGYYESAVRLDPDLSEAVYNLEASRIAAKQVEELIRKQQQQALEQKQQKEEIAKDLEELRRKQQEAAEQSKDLAQLQQQEMANSPAAEQVENQKSITAKTMEAGEKLERLNQERSPEQPDEMAREFIRRAVEKQEEAERALQQNKPSEAHANQREAATELEKLLQKLAQGREKGQETDSSDLKETGKKNEGEKDRQREGQATEEEIGRQNEEDLPVSRAPGDESPEDIINEELEGKKYHSRRSATGYKPVDKDW